MTYLKSFLAVLRGFDGARANSWIENSPEDSKKRSMSSRTLNKCDNSAILWLSIVESAQPAMPDRLLSPVNDGPPFLKFFSAKAAVA
jgi:hypothetical protein